MSDGLATMLSSPSGVTSGLPSTGPGLQLRQEFVKLPRRSSAHAMLSLHSQAGIRMIGFPSETSRAVHETLQAAWPQGIEAVEGSRVLPVAKGAQAYEGMVWNAKLWGNPWRKTGKEELDSVRLLLELLTTLAREGWAFTQKVTVGGTKGDTHTMLFSHNPILADRPPAFFALSFPLPNRISVIGAPASATPTILSAVRKAVALRPLPTGQPKSKDGAIGIKQEGFIFADCYAFKISGVSNMVVNGFGRKSYEASHPPMLLSLLNDLDANHFKLVSSLPLLPLQAGRDLLIFSSLPSSGITARTEPLQVEKAIATQEAVPRDPRKLPWQPELSIVTDPRAGEAQERRSSENPAGGPDKVVTVDNEQWVLLPSPAPASTVLPTAATAGHSAGGVRPLPPVPPLSAKVAPSESSGTTHYTDFPEEPTSASAPPTLAPVGYVPVHDVNAAGTAELTVPPALKSVHGTIGFLESEELEAPPLPRSAAPLGEEREMKHAWDQGRRQSLETRNVPDNWVGGKTSNDEQRV